MNLFRAVVPFSFVSLIVFVVYLYFGVMVLRLNTKSRMNVWFFFLCLSLAVWSFTCAFFYDAPDVGSAAFWNKLSAVGYGVFQVFALQFFLSLTKIRSSVLMKTLSVLTVIPYILILVSITTNLAITLSPVLTPYGWAGEFNTDSPVFWLFLIDVVFCIGFGFLLTFLWWRKTKLKHEKRQAGTILFSGILSFVFGIASNVGLPLAGVYTMPPIAQVFILIFIFGIGYSIKNYNLMTLTAEVAANEIVSKIMDLMVLTDPYGKIIKINKPVQEILGYHEHELIGKPFGKIVEDRAYIDGLTDNIADGTVSLREIELNYKTRKEGFIPVSVSMSSIRDKNGFVLGMVAVAHDLRLMRKLQQEVQERVKTEQELIETNEKLRELDQIKSDFISTVSHELRTPLTSILGFANIIKKRFEDTILPEIKTEDKKVVRTVRQLRDNVEIIVSEGERLTNLINDVLDIAKMEAGKTEWKTDRISVADILETATAATSSLFEAKGLALQKKIPENLPKIVGDRDRLIQVVINLISNAVKFTDEGSVIVQAELVGGVIKISVADTGVGIAPEDLEKVFDKFKQVGDTLTDKPKGTGLGLPICKQIVEHHGGHIWVKSEPGQGSEFFFIIPVEAGAADAFNLAVAKEDMVRQLKERVATAAPLYSGGKTVLVVDDESSIRELIKQEFESEGYTVAEAVDGVDAIKKIKDAIPDIIILDVMMPMMNGFDVAAVIKSDPLTKHVPIVILSIVEDRERGFSIGVDKYFTKPISMDKLLEEVEELMPRHKEA